MVKVLKEYSKRLTNELKKSYKERTLRRFRQFRQFYIMSDLLKWSTMSTKLTWSHYVELLSYNDMNKINYCIKLSEEQNLSVRELRTKIKNNEYERLDNKTKKTK